MLKFKGPTVNNLSNGLNLDLEDSANKQKYNFNSKAALALALKAILTTKFVTKGSVNVIKDSKQPAKNIKEFAKMVGKGAINVVLDSKKAINCSVIAATDSVVINIKVMTHVMTGVA